jgi:hypothetical protein
LSRCSSFTSGKLLLNTGKLPVASGHFPLTSGKLPHFHSKPQAIVVVSLLDVSLPSVCCVGGGFTRGGDVDALHGAELAGAE